jgi:hypothetical protein
LRNKIVRSKQNKRVMRWTGGWYIDNKTDEREK